MTEKTYWDWKPIILPPADAEAFFHKWKTLHITPLVPQPDMISGMRPFKDTRIKYGKSARYEEISPPFGVPGDYFWLPEPFTILEPPKKRHGTTGKRVGYFYVFRVKYLTDGHEARKRVLLEFINSSPEFNIGATYPGSALPQYLARKKLILKSHRIERLHDISEQEARNSGIQHVCGGAYYTDYSHKPTKKNPGPKYTLSALDSFKSRWDLLHKDSDYKFTWPANPYIWVSEFLSSDCKRRRSG